MLSGNWKDGVSESRRSMHAFLQLWLLKVLFEEAGSRGRFGREQKTGVRGVRLPRGLHHHHDQHLPRGLERWRFVRGRGRQRARAPSVWQQGRHLGAVVMMMMMIYIL